MKLRKFWVNKIETEWKNWNILWLSGVRRTGKTVLCQSLENIEYYDCELPRTRRLMDDPESFFGARKGKRVALDEIHRLRNPSEFLKIAADHYPDIKVIATGSSTLQASAKFKDTLTGRKREIWLPPMISEDLKDFGSFDLKHRLHFGGLPPFFLSKELPEYDFQDWIDSYWAKDIQGLFRLEKHYSFNKFLELIFINSGGIFEATRYAAPCEISRTTISNYLNVLENTWGAHILRPYSKRSATEIVAAPKVYAFDTGFVCYFRGWHQIRNQDLGFLWEHFVLNEIHGRFQTRNIFYWRNKRGNEIDFVLTAKSKPPIAVECKWRVNNVDIKNFRAFRKIHPYGDNLIVSQDVDKIFSRKHKDISLKFMGLNDFIEYLKKYLD